MPNTGFQYTPGPLDSMRATRERQMRVHQPRNPGDTSAMQRGVVVWRPGGKLSGPQSAIERLNARRRQG